MCEKLEKELFKIRMLLKHNDMMGVLAVIAQKPRTASTYENVLNTFEDKFNEKLWNHLQRIIRYALILEKQKT